MPFMRYARSTRTLSRGAAAVALLGGAAGLGFASPAAAHVVPAQATVTSGSLSVYLVLPSSTGGAVSKTAQTTEQLSAFSLSTTAPASAAGAGLGAGKAGVASSQATATMPIDTTSTNLLQGVLESHILNPLEIVFRRGSGGKQTTFLTYDFTNCIVTSYQLQDGPGTQPQETSGSPSVQITFVFQGIKLSYSAGAVGSVPASWSITTNKAV